MNQPLYRIRELIKELPGKDATLAAKFLEKRNFQGILELVDSDIYKARKTNTTLDMTEESLEEDSHLGKLLELKSNLDEYMSFLDIPDNSDDLYEDCI